jgi:hypothetical protein
MQRQQRGAQERRRGGEEEGRGNGGQEQGERGYSDWWWSGSRSLGDRRMGWKVARYGGTDVIN